MFLATGKRGAKNHALTIQPPQNHHNLPSKNTRQIAKPPAKTPIPPRRTFSCKNRRIEAWESAEKTLWTAFKAMI
jgi:hypothetical protein